MSNSFEEIFSSLLDAYEKNPNADIDALIKEQAKAEGLTDADQADLDETMATVEDLHKAEMSLAEAKENGDSRQDWLHDQMDEITKDLNDDQKDTAAKAILEAQNNVMKDYAEAVEQSETNAQNNDGRPDEDNQEKTTNA